MSQERERYRPWIWEFPHWDFSVSLGAFDNVYIRINTPPVYLGRIEDYEPRDPPKGRT